MSRLLTARRLLAACLLTGAASPARAQFTTYTWTGNGANDNWFTSENWDQNQPPANNTATTKVVLAGTTKTTNALDYSFGAYSLEFDAAAGAFVVSQSGTQSLTLGAGGLFVEAGNANNQTFNAGLALAADQVWANNGSGLLTIGGPINNGGFTLSVSGSGDSRVSGLVSGTGGLTKIGAGTLTLTNTSNSFSGAVSVTGGVLSIAGSGAFGPSAGPTSTVTLDGGTLRNTTSGNAGNFINTNRALVIGPNGGTVDYSPSGTDYSNVSIYGTNTAIKGTGTLTKTGAGEFRYQGTDRVNTTFTKLVVDRGLFRLGNVDGFNTELGFGAAPTSFTPDAITLNGGSIGASFGVTLNSNRGITLGPRGGTFNTSSGAMVVPGAITGSGGLTKGTGTLTLSSTGSSYTGSTTVTGTLSVASLANGTQNSSIGASSADAGNLVLNGGTLTYTGGAVSTDRLFSITSAGGTLNPTGGAITFTNTGAILSTDKDPVNFTLNSGSTLALLTPTGTPADLTGLAPGMGVSGTGIAAGTTVNSVSGLLAQFSLSSGATATVPSTTLTFTSLNRTLTLSGTVAGNSIAGVLGDSPTRALSVTKSGTSTWELTGANTYTGLTTVTGGSLQFNSIANVGGGASALGAPTTAANGTISIGTTTTGATLQYTGSGDVSTNRVVNLAGTTGGATLSSTGTGSVAFTGGVTATGAGAKTLTLTGTSTGANSVGGIVNSSGGSTAVSKTGSGTWVLTGTNSYTGNTTVTAGTLRVNGSAATSAFSVTGSGTVGGTGTAGASLAVSAAGTVSPGNSPGTLSTGALTFGTNGNYNWQVFDAAGTLGSGYDTISATSLNIDATSDTPFVINLWSLSAANASGGAAQNFNANQSYTWTLVDTTGGVSNFSADKFQINTAAANGTGGFINSLDGGSFAVGLSNGDLVLTFAPVPEPGTVLGAAATGLGLARWVRRRRAAPVAV